MKDCVIDTQLHSLNLGTLKMEILLFMREHREGELGTLARPLPPPWWLLGVDDVTRDPAGPLQKQHRHAVGSLWRVQQQGAAKRPRGKGPRFGSAPCGSRWNSPAPLRSPHPLKSRAPHQQPRRKLKTPRVVLSSSLLGRKRRRSHVQPTRESTIVVFLH